MSSTKTYADGRPFVAASAEDIAIALSVATRTHWAVGLDNTATGGAWVLVLGTDTSDTSAPRIVGRMTGGYVHADRMRLELSGMTPAGTRDIYVKPDEYPSDITVKAGSDNRTVARAIVKRLLPDYLPKHAALLARVQAHQDGERLAREAAVTLQEAAPYGSRVNTHGSDALTSVSIRTSDGYGDVKVYHGGQEANLSLHGLPVATVRALLETLRQHTSVTD